MFSACICVHYVLVCSHVCVYVKTRSPHFRCISLSLSISLSFRTGSHWIWSLPFCLGWLTGCLLNFPGSTCLCICMYTHTQHPVLVLQIHTFMPSYIWGLWHFTVSHFPSPALFISFKRLTKWWVVEGDSQFLQIVLWPPYMCHGMHVYTYTHKNK